MEVFCEERTYSSLHYAFLDVLPIYYNLLIYVKMDFLWGAKLLFFTHVCLDVLTLLQFIALRQDGGFFSEERSYFTLHYVCLNVLTLLQFIALRQDEVF